VIARRHTPRRALSLIEVLLALTILLLAVVAIGRLVDVGTDRGNDARANTRGTRLAQSKMAEVEAGVIALDSTNTGQFEGDDAAWSYTVTPESAGAPNLYTVTVRVTRDISGRQFEVILTQMIFDPTLLGSTAQAERPPPPDTTDPNAMGGTTP
jgi:Tfp pilus assembly protein PilV